MKCQIKKKNNSRCDKDSSIIQDTIHMCKQHYKTFLKNNVHQYGTCLDAKTDILNLSIKEYLFEKKIKLIDLDD